MAGVTLQGSVLCAEPIKHLKSEHLHVVDLAEAIAKAIVSVLHHEHQEKSELGTPERTRR